MCGGTEACACAYTVSLWSSALKNIPIKDQFREKLLRTESGIGYRLVAPQQD
jgi:hypothetical protein